MLSKKERLSREKFNRFFSLGKKTHSPNFTLVYSVNSEFHASVVVSKKVYKSAVKRNRIRRQIYDMVRGYHEKYTCGGVFIFVVKPAIQGSKTSDIKNEVHEIIKKVTRNTLTS